MRASPIHKTKAPDQNDLTPSVDYDLTLSNFYTNQRKVLKFIEFWGRTVFQIKSRRFASTISRLARGKCIKTHGLGSLLRGASRPR